MTDPGTYKTWAALAKRLGMSVSTLRLRRNQEGAPTSKNLREWCAFLGRPGATTFEEGEQTIGPSGRGLPGTSAYDEAIAAGEITPDQALKRERIRGQELENARRDAELAEANGRLIDRAEHRRKLMAIRDAFIGKLKSLPKRVASDLPEKEFPASRRRAVSDAIQRRLLTLMEEIRLGR